MVILLTHVLQQLQLFGWVIFSLLLLFFLIHVIQIFMFSGRVAWLKKAPREVAMPLSVIMTLRNEEENLRKNLPGILSAGKADYEVVVIDDFSHDDTLTFLGTLRHQEPKLRFSSLSQETRYSEKMARNIALKSSRNEWVIFVSPSTSRMGSLWPEGIMLQMHSPADVVINYSNVEPEGRFINLLFRLELFFQQLKSFGFIMNGFSYIVTEENVAFRKQKYFEGGGFRGKMAESYVNLELVINTFIQKSNTSLELTDDTSVFKSEQVTISSLLELLKKEARLLQHLSPVRKALFFSFEWVHILFLPLVVLMLFKWLSFWPLVVALTVLPAIGYTFIIKKVLVRLGEGKLFLPSLLFALLWPYFKVVYRTVYNYSRRQKRWKERK
ncbi:MAG: glycosyltransferase [Mariniphaga sp.]|nr:glycosyltransferase [Mariniphaga sp.]